VLNPWIATELAMDRFYQPPAPAVPTSTSLVRDRPLPSAPIASPARGDRAAVSPLAGRVSLAHDYLLVMRGAERTFAAIADLYADAPIFTLLHDEHGTQGRFADHAISTSSLQRLRIDQSSFRRLMPLYPRAIERLRLPPSDVVLSSSSAFAHGVRVPDGAVHVCYCYTPFRYAWDEEGYALGEISPLLRPLLRRQLRRIRAWDLRASARVDSYIAISELSRERIKRHYGREAPIIYPPVETHRFAPGSPGDSLLVVSELLRHKRIHVALEAARRARAPITVAGAGPDRAALEAGYPEAEFLGRVSDEDLAGLYASARAVLMPSVEEFGITAVEAQAAGRPVIAAAAGGALETVLDGRTGRLVRVDDVDSFAHAIAGIERLDFDPAQATRNAERFSVKTFERRLSAHVSAVLAASPGVASGQVARATRGPAPG
jgi:glycosyltransferase involved in cell wall biosynthesis